jgi:tRNA modification GTPase
MSDLHEEGNRVEGIGSGGRDGVVWVSTVSGSGLDELRDHLPSLMYGGLVRMGAESPVLTRERHARGVGTAVECLRAFLDALAGGVPAEMASTHLRPAETALEELLGVISTDEVLDRVFSDFCVGK